MTKWMEKPHFQIQNQETSMSGEEHVKREFWKIQDAWSILKTSEFWCRMWTEQAGLMPDSFMTLVLQQLMLQMPRDTLSLQTNYVSLVWPSGRVRKKWWSFSFHLHLPYPSKGKLATSNNTLAMTNIKVIVGSDISRGFWLRRGSSKPKGSGSEGDPPNQTKGQFPNG